MRTSMRAAALAAASALIWSGTAAAQDYDDDEDVVVVQQPAPTAQPAPVVQTVPAEEEREIVTEKGGPSTGMLTSGIVVFGVSYGSAVLVGATSDRDSDRHLMVPFAGPWISLADRDGCNATSEDCDGETLNKVLIGADGVFQAVGGLLVIGAFLNPQERTTSRTNVSQASLQVTPAVGNGLWGLAAFGKF
jgi:hypothetical protein